MGSTDQRQRPGLDVAAAERAFRDLIRAFGLDPEAESEFRDTPARAAELFAGLFATTDPTNLPGLETFPHQGGDDLVVVRGIRFHALCVHHLVPFFGHATIAYRPAQKLFGVGGAARLLEWAARRPQLQERMTQEIADQIERLVEPRGVEIIVRARHLCMEMRGTRGRATLETRVVRGELAKPGALPADLG